MIAELTEIRLLDPENRPGGGAPSAELDNGYSTKDASEQGIPPGEELTDPSPREENKPEVDEPARQTAQVETQPQPEPVVRAAGELAAKAASGADTVDERDAQNATAAPEQPAKAADARVGEPATASERQEHEIAEPAVTTTPPAAEPGAAVARADITETRASNGSGDAPSGTSDEGSATGNHAEHSDKSPAEDVPDSGDPPGPPELPPPGGEDSSDDRDRLIAEHAAAYPRFDPQVEEARHAYRTDPDYATRPDFVAHGGVSQWPTSAVFGVVDPADGKQCVVGLHPDNPYYLSEDAIRYEVLLRGAGMGPEFRDVVEQPVAYDTNTNTAIRELMPGDEIGSLTAEQKASITTDTLEDGLTTLEAMAREGIMPDGAHDRNTLLNPTTGRLGFVDNIPIEQGGQSEAGVRVNAGHAFLGTLNALATPTPGEADQTDAWRPGAHLYEEGARILHDRYPELDRVKDLLMLPRPIGESAEPEIGPMAPELPFYQQWFQGVEPQDEQDLGHAERTFAGFVDGAFANAVPRPSETEPDAYETETTGRDGRRITIQVKQDEGGRVTARKVVIPWSDSPDNAAATTYEATYIPGDPRPEYVFRDEHIPGVTRADIWWPDQVGEEDIDDFVYDRFPENLGANNQAVGMREVVGLTEYLRDE